MASSYTTTFLNTENPISENNNWDNNLPLAWDTRVQSIGGTPGHAIGPNSAASDDSISLLNTYSGSNNYRVSGTVFNNGTFGPAEIELLVRATKDLTNNQMKLYEIDIVPSLSDSASIVIWNGNQGDATVLNSASSVGTANGGTYNIDVSGGAAAVTINVTYNGNLVTTTTNAGYAGGFPGIGFDAGSVANGLNFGWQSWSVSDNAPSAVINGNATTGITAADIVAGGKQVIATVSGDTFVPLSSTAVISLRGTPKANNAANGGNVVLTFDTGGNAPQTGDWVIVFGGHGNAVTSLLPPGQNAVNDGTYSNVTNHTGSAVVFGVWKKKMGATPDTKVTCSGAGNSSDGVAYAAWVFQNVDPVTSEDATVTVNNATSTNPNPASITTNTNGALVLAIAGSQVNDTTPGTVSGYSNQITSNGNDTNPITVSGMVKIVATAGAEDPAAFSTWSSGIWRAATMALKPRVDTPFNNSRQAIINGTVGNSAGAHGWNNEVQAKIAVTDVVRTSNTVVTITLDAEAGYNINANENVVVTLPNSAMASNQSLVGTPQFVISTGSGATIKYTQLEHAVVRGAFRGIVLGRK